jgi:D-tyrosyl-tRNA(Tyr) deacylase
MIAVIQRVKHASVSVEEKLVGSCNMGLLILLGVSVNDTEEDAKALSRKISNLRIFTDENDKLNLSIKDVAGEALVVSNFTLLANYKKGNRPDYLNSARPEAAEKLYEYFVELLSEEVTRVEKGAFGEHMIIDMCGDGPITLVLDSNVLLNK